MSITPMGLDSSGAGASVGSVSGGEDGGGVDEGDGDGGEGAEAGDEVAGLLSEDGVVSDLVGATMSTPSKSALEPGEGVNERPLED